MNFRVLGRTGLRISEFGLGALEIGRNWPNWRIAHEDFARPNESDALRLVASALDLGINFIDTAPAYVASEEILGKALKGHREKVVLATKCGEWFDGKTSVYDYSYEGTFKFIENSLAKLQTDRVDLLQIHSGKPDVIRKGETMRAMKEIQTQGKARFLGISVDSEEAALLAIRSGDFDCVQISYNVLKRGAESEVLPEAAKRNVGIIVKDSLATGRLSSKRADVTDEEVKKDLQAAAEKSASLSMDLVEYALRFVLRRPEVSSVLLGTRRIEHLRENVKSGEDAARTARVAALEAK